MQKITMVVAGLAAAAAFSAPAAAAVNLVQNGNFSAGLTNWTTFPQAGAGADIKATTGADYVANAGGVTSGAQTGNTFASFGSGDVANTSGLFSNAFDTVAGQLYTLTFDFASFGYGGTTQQLSYALFGTSFAGSTSAQSSNNNLDTIFQNYSVSFTGTGSPTYLQFNQVGQQTASVDGLLDNVSITAVPETATWAMMFLGFGAIGATLRRRRTATAKLALS